MKHNNILLIVPPCIDWSMPMIALPLLKKCIDDAYHVDIVDLNVAFFEEIFCKSDYKNLKSALRKSIEKRDLAKSIEIALSLMHSIEGIELGDSEKAYMRKVHVFDNWMYSESVFAFLNEAESMTEKIIRQIIDRNVLFNRDIMTFCVSISVEDQIVPSFILLKIIRELFSDSKIIIGGNIPSRLYNELIHSSLKKYFDILLVGEGEVSLKTALRRISNNDVRDEPEIMKSSNEGFDFATLKRPDFSWCAFDKYLACFPIVPITLNRKCDWGKCDFCAIHSCWDDSTRERDISDVINDIKYYYHVYGVKFFRIIDENVNPNLLERFADALLQTDIEIYYEAYTRFSSRFTDEMVAKIFHSGCRQLFWGIESINDGVLKLVRKGTTKTIITENLNTFANHGILNYCFVLTGIPNTDEQSEQETIEYIVHNTSIHVAAIGSYVVDRLSPMEKEPEIIKKYDITLYSKGDLTTEKGFLFRGMNIDATVKKRTEQYIEKIYRSRGDFALTAMLDEETRLILCSFFGNDFAKQAFSLLSKEDKELVYKMSTCRSTEERVLRNSGEDYENNLFKRIPL